MKLTDLLGPYGCAKVTRSRGTVPMTVITPLRVVYGPKEIEALTEALRSKQ